MASLLLAVHAADAQPPARQKENAKKEKKADKKDAE